MFVVVAGLIGLHAAGAIPAFAVAVSEQFGSDSFGRGFGLGHLVWLPFNLLSVPIVSSVYIHTGSYTDALIGLSVTFLLIGIFAAVAGRGSESQGTQCNRLD